MRKTLRRKWHRLLFLDYRILVKKSPTLESCPNCKKMASLERLMEPSKFHRLPRYIGFKEYHCRNCKWDGYIYQYRFTNNIKKIISNYLIALFLLFLLYLLLLFFFDKLLLILGD